MDDSAKVSFDDNAFDDIALDLADDVQEEVVESAYQAEVEKFDTSNTADISQKLSKLYSEFDTLVIDEDKLRDLTTVKAQEKAVEPVSFRSMLYFSLYCSICSLYLSACKYIFLYEVFSTLSVSEKETSFTE